MTSATTTDGTSPGPDLFDPLPLGAATCQNRIALAPMTVAYANPDGTVSDAEIEHYARRAQGGVALVITEHFTVNEAGRQLPRQTVVDREDKLPGLAALAEAVHEEGALIVAQIGHAGRYAGPWDRYEERPRLAPSAVPFTLLPGRIVTPTEMTTTDIARTVADTAAAASLTRKVITAAIASGATACAITSAWNIARFLGVSSSCGATAFTRIPCGRSSISRMRVKWTRAALLTP